MTKPDEKDPIEGMDEAIEADAVETLDDLIHSQFSPERLDQAYDVLKLLGAVLGRYALLKVVTDPRADDKNKVSAARALVSLKERPDEIALRLRASQFADLSIDELQAIVQAAGSGVIYRADLKTLIDRVKKERSTHTNSKE